MTVAQPDPAPVRIPKPESLEAKFKLLQMLPHDRRVKRKHCLVYGFILDWYHSKYGDALASVRHIVGTVKERDPFERGLYAGDVHGALTDLVEWGYLEQEKGTGRRASRYTPVWSRSVHKTPNTTDDEISVRETPNTGVRETPNATDDSVRDSMNEDPSTLIRSQDPDTGVVEYDCATPTAPPGPGLEGRPGAGMAQEGFEELYRIYGVRKSKADARRAYEKIAPDADLHARMVEAAQTWKTAAGNNVERMHLARWIREERYDEDPRTERKPRQHVAGNQNTAKKEKVPRRGMRTVDIIYADTDGDGNGGTVLNLTFSERDKPVTWDRSMIIDHPDYRVREKGQAEFAALCRALDIPSPEEPDELLGAVVIDVGYGGKIEYHSLREAA